MNRRKQSEAEKDNTERWLLSYADFITLVMIFFVVMYSMSQVDAAKFKAIAQSLNVALGGGTSAQMEIFDQPSGPDIMPGSNSSTEDPQGSGESGDDNQPNEPGDTGSEDEGGNTDLENLTIEGIKARLDQFSADNKIQTQLVSSIEERGLVVSIQDTLLFESGSANITPRAEDILDKIATVLVSAPNFIRVEGHTDNLPINTARFRSNWELSVLRSTNVVQILQNSGGINPDRLSATGFGEYRPIDANDTDAGRSRNRRVDLVILRSKYDSVEPGSGGAALSDPLQTPITAPMSPLTP